MFYSSEPEKLREVLRDVFGFDHVDAGGGWLIFRLPPTELGVHPTEGEGYSTPVHHDVSFTCDDIDATVEELRGRGIDVKGEPKDQGFGIEVMLGLPGGVEVMLYQPKHPSPS